MKPRPIEPRPLEPDLTAPAAPRLTLKRQQADFTAEGAPPPGQPVGGTPAEPAQATARRPDGVKPKRTSTARYP